MEKWKEKSTFLKVVDVISWVALCVWLIFEALERVNKIKAFDFVNYIAVLIICICETISFWNVKRSLSYVAIAGAVCMIAVITLELIPVA